MDLILIPVVVLVAAFAATLIWMGRRAKRASDPVKQALQLNELELFYQPIVRLTDGEWVGAEALLRWRGPNGTVADAEKFLPMAQAAGLMEPISERVIEMVSRDMADLLRRRPGFHVAINMPPDLLGSVNLRDAAARFGMIPLAPQVIIEITEDGIVDEKGRDALARARSVSARVAIDDFGTGFNSLAQLHDMEVDFIKIDQGFVRRIGTDPGGSKMVDAIVAMARPLAAHLIAEGVETDAQAEYLRNLGVEFAQGWYFSPPMSRDELIRRLE